MITKEDEKCIADAKYKSLYNKDGKYDIDNVRQLSGYARDKEVFNKLGMDENQIIDCILIYPFPLEKRDLKEFKINLTESVDIGTFIKFKKIGVPLPIVY